MAVPGGVLEKFNLRFATSHSPIGECYVFMDITWEKSVRLKMIKSFHKKCLISVSSQGEPIAQDDLNKIFKRFYRADNQKDYNIFYVELLMEL